MNLNHPEPGFKRIKTGLKTYRILIFWLIWGISMGVMFGIILHDFQTVFIRITGFGIFLGVTLQFIGNKWLRRAAILLCITIAAVLFWKPVVSFTQRVLDRKISRELLVEDVRQMAAMLESTHHLH